MIFLEASLSFLTLFQIFLLSERYNAAPLLGILISLAWIFVWFASGQYGFLILGAGYVFIYFRMFIKQLEEG